MEANPDKTVRQWTDEGRELYRSGAIREARNAFQAAIKLAPEYGRAYFGRGVCHYRLGNYRRATEDINAAALLGCEDAGLWSRFEGGDAEENRGDDQD